MPQQPPSRRFLRLALAEVVVVAVGVVLLALLTVAVDGNAHLITAPFRLQP